jgi:hypothetical protein
MFFLLIQGAFERFGGKYVMHRPFCSDCNENYAAINYQVDNKTYFRSKCAACLRKLKKKKPVPPAWIRAGYKKKSRCDKCGFTATNLKTQLRVFYVDGNLKNNDWANLKTICLNCQAGLLDSKLTWKPADLIPDY